MAAAAAAAAASGQQQQQQGKDSTIGGGANDTAAERRGSLLASTSNSTANNNNNTNNTNMDSMMTSSNNRQRPPSPPPTREYTELMELVDHAVHFDWTTAGLIMGSSFQKQQLQEEQKNLLYSGTSANANAAKGGGIGASASAMSPAPGGATSATDGADEPKKPATPSFALTGWGERNLVSPRVAWARVRRREQPTSEQKRALQQQQQQQQPDGATVVASPVPTASTTPAAATVIATTTAWEHEEKAQEDPALCLLSEATQIYVTQILQKALMCARQRQNLDGIRLWHQQCTAAVEVAKAEKDETADTPTPPPLSIRLGCDVSRQVARTMGNAALTSKRMEEALERQKPEETTRVIPSQAASTLNAATVASAQSMGELSLLPPLANASEKADYEAKKNFEIYGGKHSHDPPFGRVPKKAKLEVADFQQGLQMNNLLGSGGRANRRHRASPHAFSFSS